jgi:hypothetical protein
MSHEILLARWEERARLIILMLGMYLSNPP